MALDTRDRRASAVHVGLPWRGLLPLPDPAAEDQGDRQQTVGYYRGVLATSPTVAPAFMRIGAITMARAGVGLVSLIRGGVGPVALRRAGVGTVTLTRAGTGPVSLTRPGVGKVTLED